jgi:hypothetical protein
MRPALWRLVGTVLIVLGAFAGGIGAYAGSRALWPMLVLWWPWLLAGVAAVVALGAWWLWWRLPKWQMQSVTAAGPKDRADIEDNFRKTIGQLLGGAAVLIGAGFAYLQFIQQQRAAHDLLISNQVAKGFELLGNKDNQIQQRLGGIYALEGVMNDSGQYHRPVLEALSAFVRDGTRTGDGPPATDIQAALTVIGRRKAGIPNLANAHIPKADLYGADLSGANLSGANLSGADLSGANLSDAHLIGAGLSGAHLIGADLSRVNLTDANLTGAKLSFAKLSFANLTRTGLGGADLTFANLTRTGLGGIDLTGANLREATVSQAQLDHACGTDVKLDPPLTIKPCQK